MKHERRTSSGKPYDLRERLLLFACDIVGMVQYLCGRGPVGIALSAQVLKSGTSAGANYEEAVLQECLELKNIIATLVNAAKPSGDEP